MKVRLFASLFMLAYFIQVLEAKNEFVRSYSSAYNTVDEILGVIPALHMVSLSPQKNSCSTVVAPSPASRDSFLRASFLSDQYCREKIDQYLRNLKKLGKIASEVSLEDVSKSFGTEEQNQAFFHLNIFKGVCQLEGKKKNLGEPNRFCFRSKHECSD